MLDGYWRIGGGVDMIKMHCMSVSKNFILNFKIKNLEHWYNNEEVYLQ